MCLVYMFRCSASSGLGKKKRLLALKSWSHVLVSLFLHMLSLHLCVLWWVLFQLLICRCLKSRGIAAKNSVTVLPSFSSSSLNSPVPPVGLSLIGMFSCLPPCVEKIDMFYSSQKYSHHNPMRQFTAPTVSILFSLWAVHVSVRFRDRLFISLHHFTHSCFSPHFF